MKALITILVLLKTRLFHLYNIASGINLIPLLIRVIIRPGFSFCTKCCLQYNKFNSRLHLGTGYDITRTSGKLKLKPWRVSLHFFFICYQIKMLLKFCFVQWRVNNNCYSKVKSEQRATAFALWWIFTLQFKSSFYSWTFCPGFGEISIYHNKQGMILLALAYIPMPNL